MNELWCDTQSIKNFRIKILKINSAFDLSDCDFETKFLKILYKPCKFILFYPEKYLKKQGKGT